MLRVKLIGPDPESVVPSSQPEHVKGHDLDGDLDADFNDQYDYYEDRYDPNAVPQLPRLDIAFSIASAAANPAGVSVGLSVLGTLVSDELSGIWALLTYLLGDTVAGHLLVENYWNCTQPASV